MNRKILIAIVALSFSVSSSGCIFLAVGALGYGAAKAGSAMMRRHPHLTDMQRRALECKEIEGVRDDVLHSIVTVFQDRGYSIQTSDYQGGLIAAGSERPFLQVTASIEEFTKDRTNIRITMKDKDGVIEDPKVFAKLFDAVQAEVFRRSNLNK